MNSRFFKNRTVTADWPNDGFVPDFAIPVAQQVDRTPMNERRKLERLSGAGNGGLWVLLTLRSRVVPPNQDCNPKPTIAISSA